MLLAGEEIGDIFRDGKAYDVNVWSTPATRNSLSSIKNLPIDNVFFGVRAVDKDGNRSPVRTPEER